MTIDNAIRAADEARPNDYSAVQKIGWLSELDARIAELARRFGADVGYEPYTGDVDRETELLAPEGYHGLYQYWLFFQVDYNNGEILRANNDIALFDALWSEFEQAVARGDVFGEGRSTDGVAHYLKI